MTRSNFRVGDLLNLPAAERAVFLFLSRNGPADAETLAQALGRDLGGIQEILDSLLSKGRARQELDGRYEVVLGRITRRTTLPTQLWPALLAADRRYSEQEFPRDCRIV